MKLTQLATLFIGYGGLGALFYYKELKQRLVILLGMYILGKMKGGPEHSLFYSLFGINKPKYTISGYVKPGYEAVRKEYEKNFENGLERGSQLCIYVKGEKVVDLVGSSKKSKKYDEKTLQIVFSSSKSVTSIVIAMLVDRGLLRYDQKITEIWPEFGKHGKQNITLEQILRHEAGIPKLGKACTPEFTLRDAIKQNKLGEMIENTPIKQYKSGKQEREYHAVSRGLILNEIVRRVDPKNRTIGEFIEQEINKPLNTDFYFGVDEKMIKERVCELSYTLFEDPLWAVIQSWVPWFMGRKTELNPLQLTIMFVVIFFMSRQASFDIKAKNFKLGEYPSSNGISNARSLAKLGSLMASGGKVGDTRLLQEKTVQEFNSEATIKYDNLLRKKSKFTKGGNNVQSADQDCQVRVESYGFVGWSGLGGSMISWHPEEDIGFGYAMNLCEVDQCMMRSLRVRKVAYECAQKQK